MPRPSNTDQRRAQIAAGLIEVMAQRGYDGASIAEIAKAAGVTPGIIHYHFESKQEILFSAFDELVARHEARLDEHLADTDSPAAGVATFIDLHLGLGATADPQALACWVLLGGEALRHPDLQKRYAEAVARLVARLRKLIDAGKRVRTFRCKSAAEAATAIVAAIEGYFVLAATAREVIPKGSAARSVLRMAEGILQPQTPLTNKNTSKRKRS